MADLVALGPVTLPGIVPGPASRVPTYTPGATVLALPGPTGPAGSGAVVVEQESPAATWSLPNPTGRLCGVDIFVGGEQVIADVDVTPTSIVVTFAAPVTGSVVLS